MTSIDLHPEHWQEPTVVLRQLCVSTAQKLLQIIVQLKHEIRT